MDDCNEIMNLGLEDVSYMSIFNDLVETATYDRDMFHGRIIDDFSMITIDPTTADNHEGTLGTGTYDLKNDTGTHTILYSGQVEEAFGLLGNSINIGYNTANISGSNHDHKSCVEDELLSNYDHKCCVGDELLSNYDTKESVDDETNSNGDTCLVENESVRLCGENSISLDVVYHDHLCQPLCPENDFCDIDLVEDSTIEDVMYCSNFNKSSEVQRIWSILSDRLSYVVENMPTCIACTPPRGQGYHFKKWKSKQAFYDACNSNTPCRDNMASVMVYTKV